YLEDGAAGLMIPHVSCPEKARALVDAVKFPPIGDRGQDGAGLDADYHVDFPADYPEKVNAETFLVVQIETPQAVENVDAIAATNGVDGLFVGPGDLGLRLKRVPTNLTLEAGIAATATACKKHNKAWGMPVSSKADLQIRRQQGAQILSNSGDFMAIMKTLENSVRDFDD
ncbi:MAG: 4-hydroxy-2-oxovalerate aldolase, partial [Planctomycetaceae bacterium]|nr:4-hydroxy-2-oxovalerate aldolase [Planctomycetaceae bacterium]